MFGERLLPVGTLYDPFIARGLDALNYACYQDARFLLVATPSGVTLAPEGGAHQSVGTPLIGMSQDGLAAFEPAFSDELAIILEWALEYMQRDGAAADTAEWSRDAGGGSVYLRLSTRPLEQPQRPLAALRDGVVDGGYWLRPPGPNAEVVIAYQGVVASEAIAAAAHVAERAARRRCSRRHVGRPVERRMAGPHSALECTAKNAEAPYRDVAGRSSKALPDRDRDRRPPRDAVLAGGPCMVTASRRLGSSISARPGRSPTFTGISRSTGPRSSRPLAPWHPGAPSACCRRAHDRIYA